MPNLKKSNLKRRWIKARPGSVLILVIALLVLLALIGTAYLSSTQTERYTSHQNSINTEADLLIQGMQNALVGQVVASLSGNVNGISQYRPPASEMPYFGTTGATVSPTGYYNYDSAVTVPNTNPQQSDPDPADIFLADRIPNSSMGWNAISWPLFKDPSGGYTFDSPFSIVNPYSPTATMGPPISIQTGPGYNRGRLLFSPQSANVQQADGTSVIVQPTMSVTSPGAGGLGFVPPTGTALPSSMVLAADADGDGIADSLFVKVPVGQINGITYYVATRVVDGNSAINASTAFTQGPDIPTAGNSAINYGFFRSNIGLYELLNSTSRDAEMNYLNYLRYGPSFTGAGNAPAMSPNLVTSPPNYSDPTILNGSTGVTACTNYNWYSLGDIFENVLIRRPGNPGYAASGINQSQWLGNSATAGLAYKFALRNTALPESQLETALPTELYNSAPTVPYSPSATPQWYSDLFAGLNNYSGTGGAQLRTILTGSNPVSNAAPTRLGNGSATAPVAWVPKTNYNFGDWVTDVTSTGAKQSFVCIQQHYSTPGTEPGNGVNPGAVGYWAGAYPVAQPLPVVPGMPFTQQATKISVNTATFEQLWLGFAQVMADSVATDPLTSSSGAGPAAGATPQWQPPMQQVAVAAGAEPQMGMFRSVIRAPQRPSLGRTILTSSQMLQLRAALAAVNTMDLRDSDDDVTSREIVLTDGTGKPQYDVEVYGTEKQPYISEVILQNDGTPDLKSGANYVAVELCNPYPTPLTLTGWQIGSLSRATYPTLTFNTGVPLPTVTIPAAVNGVPGLLILEEGTEPDDVRTTITANRVAYPAPSGTGGLPPTQVTGLYGAAVALGTGGLPQTNEVFIMRPRRADGKSSQSAAPNNDVYDEGVTGTGSPAPAANLADMVPADQLDLTGLQLPASGAANPTRFLYRRANDDTTQSLARQGKAWHCVFPGYYDPGATGGRYFSGFNTLAEGAAAIVTDTTGKLPCYLAGPTGGTILGTQQQGENSTYTTVPIELNNVHMAGPNPIGVGNNVFPYGAFARQLDMLQIPFIGAYRIRPITYKGTASASFTELNSVTIDSALANDNATGLYALPNGALSAGPDAANGALALPTTFNEQIGRFCPVGDATSTDPTKQLDFGQGYATGAVAANQQKVYWHYHWAKKLFDYFTVQAPHDDYYPNVDPTPASGTGVSPAVGSKYPTPPVPLANGNTSTANNQTAGSSEDTVGNEGLININTAPMAVLAQLPWTGTSTAPSAATNAQLAQTIVSYRNQYGPFQSILDLYRVLQNSSVNTALLASPAGPDQGVFSPGGIGANKVNYANGTVRYDFQERFLLLNNVSNLITTRSDTFVCYILLQGWRNVGGTTPTLAVQRRLAFLVDRTNVTPSNNNPVVFKVPSD